MTSASLSPFPVNLAAAEPGDWETVRRDCLRQRGVPIELALVPDELRPLLQRALRPDPAERFTTAAKMRLELTEAGTRLAKGQEDAR